MEGAWRTSDRMERNKTGNETELAKTRVGNSQCSGRDGNAEQATHEKTGNETDRTEMLGDGLTTRRKNGQLERKFWAISA